MRGGRRSILGQPLRLLAHGTRRRRRLHRAGRDRAERGVTDAIVEADPIDPDALAAGVAVAQLNPPRRRLGLSHIVERALHRLGLRLHARLLPLAVDPDVERHRIAKRRPRVRALARPEQAKDSKEKRPPHPRIEMPSTAADGNCPRGKQSLNHIGR